MQIFLHQNITNIYKNLKHQTKAFKKFEDKITSILLISLKGLNHRNKKRENEVNHRNQRKKIYLRNRKYLKHRELKDETVCNRTY